MSLELIKSTVGIIAVLLTFAGYVPYTKDILEGKTKPHLYSWVLWTLVTSIVFALQFTGGAGVGGFVTLAAALMCFMVVVLSLKRGANKDVQWVDRFFILLALIALALWLFAKQPVLSAVLSTIIDVLGFAPTIRKSWNNPYSETLSFYYLNTLRFSLAVFALSEYSLVTALYPVTWIFANGLFALMLVSRRKIINHQTLQHL